MADFGFNTNIPLGIQPAKNNLADMVGTAAGLQSYQQARELNPIQLEAARLQLQQAQQINPLEVEAKNLAVSKARQTLPFEVKASEATSNTAQSQANAAQLELMHKHQGNFARESLKLLNRPQLSAEDIDDFLVKTIRNAGGNDQVIAQARSEVPTTGTTADLKAWLARHSLNALTAEAQIEKTFPSATMQNLGATSVPMTMGSPFLAVTPPGTPAGPASTMTVPPGSRMVATGGRDMHNNPEVNVFSAEGRFLGQTTVPANVPESALPGAAPAAAPTASRPVVPQAAAPAAPSMGVVRMPVNETEGTMTAARNIQLTANKSATSVPQSQFNLNQIIKLADEAATGKGSEIIQGLTGGYAGIQGLFGSTNMADALNKLGHYMDLETASLAASAGLGTDAARAMAAGGVGKTTWTADAIKSTARINRAFSTGIDLFNQGINMAVAEANNNPIAAREFQNKWSKVADVNAFRLMDAMRNNDKIAVKELMSDLGGINSDKYKKVKLSVNTINKMIGGQ